MPAASQSIFYHPAYLKVQRHENFKWFETDNFRLGVTFEKGVATSLPRGLFGSIELLKSASEKDFIDFIQGVKEELTNSGINK